MIKVLKPGLVTTIQDAGRFGYREFGVPVSGAMDLYSYQFANALLGNGPNAACLEINLMGPKLQFLKPTQIVISGADLSPRINTTHLDLNRIYKIKANDILSFGRPVRGLRSYLAIKGGFQSEIILGSRSMLSTITKKNHVRENDIINYQDNEESLNSKNSKMRFDDSIFYETTLIAFKGPEFNQLDSEVVSKLVNTDFKVSNLISRMAYQIDSKLENSLESILTAPVLPGTVQLTPSGRLIVAYEGCANYRRLS